ncbi:branched-chain amino acid ABC transporter permease [Rubellimicrobium aerolatum]|uniref:Branched-chain amino acid ABC transporter permease n=1 Tax=Rubellimicrobium aerolatum TaxID=490979 RepID=A0ABW0S891_9RHOB|nr:branched-chain amino acid ABC transporter permease [Rubellimicrobium aerolatum]MBP1804309.1 branched-chain amino acid transport system permease protein [Rubellimicrobium aerolatum]
MTTLPDATLAKPIARPDHLRAVLLYAGMAALIAVTGAAMGWNYALTVVNMGLISAIMALGVNLQWGFAGLFNVGVMGFVALGGLATVLVATPPQPEAWSAGGLRVIAGLALGALTVVALVVLRGRMTAGRGRALALVVVGVLGFLAARWVLDPGVLAVEAVNPSVSGNLGGLGLPVLLAWPAGGLLAAGAAWIIGKTALGLRSDYLAIATLGIAEIILAVMKNEDWLARGVKNVVGLPAPVPQEIALQTDPAFVARAASLGLSAVDASTLWVKVLYLGLFAVVLAGLLLLAQLALKSPWGRMMRAIRDNEVAAEAMGKDVTARHLQIFVLGSALCGIAGAMMVTLDGQLTPGSYQPLRYTFLIWVMVIVGGSGNNWGAVLGGFLIWWLWVIVEPVGNALFGALATVLPPDSPIASHLQDASAHMRLLTMGLVLLLMLRFSPRGLIPER